MIGKIIKIAGKKYKVVARTSGNEYTLEEVIESKDDKFTEIIFTLESSISSKTYPSSKKFDVTLNL